MGNVTYRYYFADRPSPLHEALDQVRKERDECMKQARPLMESVGACNMTARGSLFEGFTFAAAPPADKWIPAGQDSAGHIVYRPRRNTKAGRDLAAAVKALRLPEYKRALKDTKLEQMVCVGGYVYFSTIGFRDERIFVGIPESDEEGADAPPPIPEYLVECKKWEMERFFDLGRQAAAAQEA